MSIDVQTDIRNTCLYDGGHFAVLMAMADCANTITGEGIYPGMDLLSANARLKQRRTVDIVQELREDLVVVLQSADGEDLGPDVQPSGGRGKKTEYRIDLERVQELQGLHEQEVAAGRVSCHFCDARRKRALARAGKGAISSTKGAKNDLKGAISDVKGAIRAPHIDRTKEPSEPSGEPSLPPPASEAPGTSILALGDASNPKPPAKPERPKSQGTRWPEGQRVPPDWHDAARAACTESNLDPPDLRIEVGKFERYWPGRAGAGGLKANWKTTFINWIVKAAEDAANRSKTYRKSGANNAHQRGLEGLAQLVIDADGESKGVPRPGELALAAPKSG